MGARLRAPMEGCANEFRRAPPRAAGGDRASFVTGGMVVRPTSNLTIAGRATRWTAAAGQHHDYAWVDGAARVNGRLTVHVGARPLSGAGAPQASGGVDVLVVQGQVA